MLGKGCSEGQTQDDAYKREHVTIRKFPRALGEKTGKMGESSTTNGGKEKSQFETMPGEKKSRSSIRCLLTM